MNERARPGGRSEEVRRRVAAACLSLLAEGNTELRPVDVAARAVISRATVYRWWPTTEALVDETMRAHVGARLDPPDAGSWAKDVRKYMAQLAAFFADPVEVALNAVMAQGRHSAQDEHACRGGGRRDRLEAPYSCSGLCGRHAPLSVC